MISKFSAVAPIGAAMLVTVSVSSLAGTSERSVTLVNDINSSAHYSLKSFNAPSRESASVPDDVLNERVANALAADRKISGQVRVSTHDGIVKVVGGVESTAMVYRVIETIESVDGVRGVDEDELTTL